MFDSAVISTSPKRVRSRRGEGGSLRDEILDVAEAILYETADADAVAIRAIGQRVGVTAPSIYRHFPDKDDLIRAVCVRGFGRMKTLFDERLDGVTDPIDRIRALARAYADFGLGNPAQYRVLLMSPSIGHHQTTQETGQVPSFSDRQESMGGLLRLLEVVDSAIAAGCVRSEDPLQLALMLWTNVHGMVSLRIAEPEMPWPSIDDHLELMFRLLATGMLVSPDKPSPESSQESSQESC